jgi:hypothetical protein
MRSLEEIPHPVTPAQFRADDLGLPVRKPASVYQDTGRAFPDGGPMARRAVDRMIAERRFAIADPVADIDALCEAGICHARAGAEQAGTGQRV